MSKIIDKNKRMYFTKEHEDAIVEFNNSTDMKRRSYLYEKIIHPAIDELVDKIVYTYKFTSLPDIAELQQDCKVMLVTILHKFEPEKGHKAFSYFSVITKNWFIAQVKKNKKKNQRETSLDAQIEAGHEPGFEDVYEDDQCKEEFINLLRKEMLSWESISMRPNEKKVYDAINTLLDNADKIEIFNKKAIYLYLREITGLNTKQIVSQLSKMREKYCEFRKRYENGEE